MKTIMMKTGMIAAVLALAACAGMPKNDKLQEARAAYQAVKGNPQVARVASEELRTAKNELETAEDLLQSDAPVEDVEHHAYLSKRHSQIAAEQAKRASMQEEIESFSDKREQLLMAAQISETEMLRRKLAAMEAEKTERGMVLTLGDVLFDLNESDLKPGGIQVVEELARFMKDYPERTVLIEGYTDSTGSKAYNQQLSEARARSVKQALVARGISASRIMIKGYGEQYPVASNETGAGRQLNRRVEIVISDAQGNVEKR